MKLYRCQVCIPKDTEYVANMGATSVILKKTYVNIICLQLIIQIIAIMLITHGIGILKSLV